MINMEWYHALNKPLLSPPDWIFAPVWIALYFMMAISLLLFLKGGFSKNKILPFSLFFSQLILNLLWTPAFFYMQNIKLGFIILVLLWITVLLTINSFYKFSKAAAILLIPYFIWTTFALYLNFEILRLN